MTPETVALRKVQGALAKPPVVKTAQAMSLFGEHAIGWLAIGAVGALADRERRGEWAAAAAGVAAAHAASIAVAAQCRPLPSTKRRFTTARSALPSSM